MKTYPKYDPEDIESLMLAKAFDELLPEEKVFVLKHLSSEAGYESMRMLLLESVRTFESSRMDPPDALKHRVMNRYRTKHTTPQRDGFRMNLYLFFRNVVLEKPHFALAAASVLIFAGAYFWIIPQETTEMAVQHEMVEPNKSPENNNREDSKAVAPATISEQQFSNEVSEETNVEIELNAEEERPVTPIEEVIPVTPSVSERSMNEENNAGSIVQDAVQMDALPVSSGAKYAADEVEVESPEPPPSSPALVNNELIALLYTAR